MTKHEPSTPGSGADRAPRLVLLAALGHDDSDPIVAAMALQAARAWAGAELHLVHVVDVLPVAQAAVAARPDWACPGLDGLRDQGGGYLDRMAQSTGEALGRPVAGHLLVGTPAAEIVGLAKRLRAALLVVGTRDAGLLSRLLVGSTAESLLHKAPCSVLLARAPTYAHEAAARPEGAVCPDCLRAEAESGGSIVRCDRHALAYGRTHGAAEGAA